MTCGDAAQVVMEGAQCAGLSQVGFASRLCLCSGLGKKSTLDYVSERLWSEPDLSVSLN